MRLHDLAIDQESRLLTIDDTLPYGYSIVVVNLAPDDTRRLVGGVLQWIPSLLKHIRDASARHMPSGSDLRVHRVETIHHPTVVGQSHVYVLIEVAHIDQEILPWRTAALPVVAAKWLIAAVAAACAVVLMAGVTISLFKVSDRLAEALIRPVESVAEEVGEAARWAVPVVVGLLVLWVFSHTAGRGAGAKLKTALSGRAQARG